MSSRLPVPGGDDNTWGIVLNDFLDVIHNVDGSLKLSALPLDTDGTLSSDSDSLIATEKAVKTYVDNTTAAGAPDATSSTPGLVELTGDFSGAYNSPTVVSTHLVSALPLSQGGTGSTTQNFVDLASSQTIGGSKTFSTKVSTAALQVTTSPTSGNVLVSDSSGNATWQSPTATVGQATFSTSGVVKQTVFNVMDYGVVGDNVTDNTTAIQNLINTVINVGGGIVYFPIGVYRISNTLNIVGNYCTLMGEYYNRDATDYPAYPSGNDYANGGSVIKVLSNFPSNNPIIVVNTSSTIWYSMGGGIERLCLSGNSAALSASPSIVAGDGIDMYNAHDFKIRDTTVESVNLKGVYAKGTLPGGVSQAEVNHCLIRSTGSYGIHFDSGMIINWITNNFVSGIGGIGIYNQSNNNFILNNNIESPTTLGGDISVSGTGIVNTGASCFVTGNEVNGAAYHGYYVSGSATVVSGNAANQINNGNNADGSGICISDGTYYGLVVTDNTLTDNRGGSALMKFGIYNYKNVANPISDISHNAIYGAVTAPVWEASSGNAQFKDNIGANPRRRLSLGNVSGTITIDPTQGDWYVATLTGNITVAFDNGMVTGDQVTIQFRQDSTGGRTISFAGADATLDAGAFNWNTTANAVNTITLRWDAGNGWIETARMTSGQQKTFPALVHTPSGIDVNGLGVAEITSDSNNLTLSAPTNVYLSPQGTNGTHVVMSSGNLWIGGSGQLGAQAIFNGSTSGTTALQPSATASGTLTLPAATDTLVGRATTDTLTNKNLTSGTNTFPTFNQNTTGSAGSITGLSIVGGKTLTVDNSLTLSGTDSTTMTFPATSATIARTDASNTFTGHQTIEGVTSTGATGTGNLVFSASSTLTGTTTFTTLSNASGMNLSGTTLQLGAANRGMTADSSNTVLYGVSNVYICPSGTAGTHVVMSSGNVVIGGSGQTSAYLDLSNGGINIVTDTTTGTKIGTATNQKLGFYNATPVVQQTGDIGTALTIYGLLANPSLSVANGGTGTTTATGSGSVVLGSSPTIITPTVTSPILQGSATSALTYGASISTNAALGNVFTVTLTGNSTMSNPTSPTNGQKILYELTQDSTGSRIITWGSAFLFSNDIPQPVLSTSPNLIDFVAFIYSSGATSWLCIGVSRGYA